MHQPVPHGMMNWALWFIPVYLWVMILFPFLRMFYEKFTNFKIKLIPLFVFAIAVFILQYYREGYVLKYSMMLSFYGFFTYLGLFFKEIFKKQHTLIAVILAVICMSITILSILFLNQSPNMQANKFPPNFLYLIFSFGFLTTLYIFSNPLVKGIVFCRKNKIFNWVYTQYVKHGITIFLFHPFVFILLQWMKKTYFVGVPQMITFIIILFLAISLSAVLGKMFSWVERIKIPVYKHKQ
jgi:hypothetical protein